MIPGVELKGVSKTYGSGAAEVHALHEVDLSVMPGELVAVMGASGSGKSTLLTIAGTLEDPTSGTVMVGGTDVAGLSRNARARLRRQAIGYVFQDFNLLAGLSVAENVSLPLELDGVRLAKARLAAIEALDRHGGRRHADRFPDQLSGGERQRVAVARAVVGRRDLLLADEPTGALDSVNGESVMRMLRAACQDGVAGVVVTHDAQLASWAHESCSFATVASWTRRDRNSPRRRCSRGKAPRDHTHPCASSGHIPGRLASPTRGGAMGMAPLPARVETATPCPQPAGDCRCGHGAGTWRSRRTRVPLPTLNSAMPTTCCPSPRQIPPLPTTSRPRRRRLTPARTCTTRRLRCRVRSPLSTCARKILPDRSLAPP